MNNNRQLSEAYQYCRNLAAGHYENFPVASILLPKKLRKPISVIYAFARTADDFADEGNAAPESRLHQLAQFKTALDEIENNNYQGEDPIFIALADVIKRFQLPIRLFKDLLSAFEQDVVKNRYDTFEQVLDYCKRSANPVGKLLLLLQGNPTELQLQQSDAICSALQLINFYQDIIQDITESDRIYIPSDELHTYNIDKEVIINSQNNSESIAPLLRQQYQRALALMSKGYRLGTTLSGRLGWEIRAMTLGGVYILNQLIIQPDYRLLQRPRLSRFDLVKIMLLSASKKLYLDSVKKLLDTEHSLTL